MQSQLYDAPRMAACEELQGPYNAPRLALNA